MKTTTFTSTISPSLLSWLNTYAQEHAQTRREALENILTEYRSHMIKKQMRDDFSRASHKEALEMAEWGMGDYADITNS